MNDKTITYLTDVALITCVVPAGKADAIIKAARDLGARGGLIHHARGVGERERLGLLGIALEVEKEVVMVMASSEHQDLMFETLYHAGGLDAPGAGYMYMTPLDKVAAYIPKDILERMERQAQ